MERLERLRKEALDACNRRKHKMENFRHYTKGRCLSSCKVCGKTVSVISKPAPNEIDIGGEAVALCCED